MTTRPVRRAMVLVLGVLLLVSGCGGSASGESASGDGLARVLKTEEAKHVLMQLPYRYDFRYTSIPDGASGALAGQVSNRHGVRINFGLALGRYPKGVPVPGAGAGEAYGYPKGGFVYTDDLRVRDEHGRWTLNPRFHTTSQWRQAADMNVAIEERLCKAATGEPCPP